MDPIVRARRIIKAKYRNTKKWMMKTLEKR